MQNIQNLLIPPILEGSEYISVSRGEDRIRYTWAEILIYMVITEAYIYTEVVMTSIFLNSIYVQMMKNWNIDLECSYSDITFLGMFEPVVRLRKCGIYPM